MIDIENELFTLIATIVRAKYPDAFIVGEYVKTPPSFPCIAFLEEDNQGYWKTQTTSDMENHAQVLYTVNIYSNKKKAKKMECRQIASLIDEKMTAIGFHRLMLSPIPNEDDPSIYRITARYRAVVSKDKTIYRR